MRALIAGNGDLPGLVLKAGTAPTHVFALEGVSVSLPSEPERFRLETLGTLLATLTKRGVTELCLAGAITRPSIDPTLIDEATRPLVPVLQQALMQGDDGALRIILNIFEAQGIRILAAHDMVPDLLPPEGVLTSVLPSEPHQTDAVRGQHIVDAMGAADIGQACVVAGGQALVVEGMFGTEWMLNSLKNRPAQPRGGILYKAPKPDQDRRVDLPAVGLDTVHQAADAGLEGIVLEAGGVMVLNREAVIKAADAAGLFLWVKARE